MFIKRTGPSEDLPELPFEDRPPVLYHYCSIESFVKIVESGLIRLSNSTTLNDYRENTWIIPLIDEKIKELRNDETSKFIDKVVTQYNINKAVPFVASFSHYGDILSQWRSYAEDGKGVSLGVNPSSFGIRFRTPYTSDELDRTLGWVPVLYDTAIQKEAVSNLLEDFVNMFLDNEESEADLVIGAALHLRILSTFFKNPAFIEEKEWRIVHTPLILGNDAGEITLVGSVSDLKFRTTPGRIYSYLELPISKGIDSNVIAEVVKGPKCETSDFDIDLFLKAKGHKNFKITRSNASYR